jgi:hypothetical protein
MKPVSDRKCRKATHVGHQRIDDVQTMRQGSVDELSKRCVIFFDDKLKRRLNTKVYITIVINKLEPFRQNQK